MSNIAVIDTETTWTDEVMSVGMVIADGNDFTAFKKRYYIFDPEYKKGGMYSDTIFINPKNLNHIITRKKALADIRSQLEKNNVTGLYAYNAWFDKRHLPELADYDWFDIMKLAAYRQYNPFIPGYADCFSTGRLRKNYGVESILRLLNEDDSYCETHNALQDAVDELYIMKRLGHELDKYRIGLCQDKKGKKI